MTNASIKLLPILFLLLASTFVVSIGDSSDAETANGTHSISFKVNGGSGTETEWVVQSGNIIELPTQIFSRTGYYLSGWDCPSGTFVPGSKFMVSSDTVFTAQWSPVKGTHLEAADSVIGVNDLYEYTQFSSSMWDITGNNVSSTHPDWLTVSVKDKKHMHAAGSPTSPGIYYVTAHYSRGISTYDYWWTITVPSESDRRGTVVFDSNGGEGSVASVSGPIGTVVALPGNDVMSKRGHALSGWDIDVSEGRGTFPLGSYFTLKDSHYTASAHWLAEANVVILDGSGQIGADLDAFIGYQNETITLPSEGYSKAGSIFAGWRLSSAPYDIYAPGYIYTIDGPTYMSAYYISDSTPYMWVDYDANGGVGHLSQIVELGRFVVLPEKGFSNSTNLDGWISPDGSTYKPGDRVEITNDTVFKAQWGVSAPDVVTVSFDLNGGSGSVGTQIMGYGDLASRPRDPIRSAHIFLGWTVVGGGDFDFSMPVTSSITLRADWQQHFTRSYEGDVVIITMAKAFAGSPTTVDWGDGLTSSGSVSFTHVYGGPCSGTITVTTQSGVSGGTASSSVQFSVSSGGGIDPIPEPVTPDGTVSGRMLLAAAIIITLIAALVAWRFLT